MATPTPEPVTHAKALLDAANRASEKVAALHIAFLAVCAYVVVIVFSTTDMNLLIGKGIKLPVVAVDVPIVGFYATAPYLMVLIHFNLLLQLQLLSQKLYAFDTVAPQQEGIGGLRDQLNIFPYNYCLVGQRSPLVAFFVALLVTITMLLLPVAALLTVQARFLAYQSEAVTWAQRVATWLDVGIVAVLWPVILNPENRWSTFMNGVWENVKQRPLTWIWRLAGIVLAVRLLALDVPLSGILTNGLFLAFAVWLLLTLSAPAWRGAFCWLSRGRYLTGSEANPLVSGATGLVVVLLLGLPLPLMFTVDGETLDSRKALGTQILDILQLRHLDLQEGILLAKPARPETIADLCSTDPAKREAAQRSIEGINLQGRSLRRANLYRTLMPLADLRNAKLQGAELFDARLQGADLKSASLYTKWLPLTTALVDVRGLKWQPLGTKEIEQLKKVVNNWSRERPNLSFFKRLDDASAAAKFKPPTFESCLLDTNTEVKCKKSYSIYEFRIKLFEELVALACQSSDFSHGIVLRISRGSDIRDFTTEGLAIRLLDIRKKNVNKDSCPGLFALTADDTAQLARLAQQENR